MSKKTLAHLLLLAVVAVWGATFPLVKAALDYSSPLLFNLLRMSVAALVLSVVNRRYLRGLPRHTWFAGAVAGLLLAIGYQFQTVGLSRTTPSKSALITGLVVVFVPMLTVIPGLRPTSSSPPRWTAAPGAILAFLGLALLTVPSGTNLVGLTTTIGIGDLLTLICALAFAGHLLALAHLAPHIPARPLATLQIAFAAAFMLLTLPLSSTLYLHPSPRLFIALGVTGVLATAAAFTIQSWAQQHLPPTSTAVLLTLEPVFALAVSMLLFGDRFTGRSAKGAAFILCGIATIELFALPNPIAIDPA